MMFTSFLEDVEVQSDIGFVLIGMTILVLFLNLSVIIWNVVSKVAKKCYKKLTEERTKSSKLVVIDD
jgi:Na+-transporting methylmalonyl-CoA/oxaloacetate decarboxylase gamma subunit